MTEHSCHNNDDLKMTTCLVQHLRFFTLILSILSRATSDGATHLSPLRGHPGDGYCLDIYIGTPPQQIAVLVDTGSSNLAVAAVNHTAITRYFHKNESSTCHSLGETIHVPYTQGEWRGDRMSDVVTVATLPNVTAQFAGITSTSQFYVNDSQWQGILGLGYPAIAKPDSSVQPLFDTFVATGAIRNIFSMQLCGTLNRKNKDDREMGGSMVWGGTDASLYSGQVLYTPIVKERFYEIAITDVHVASASLGLDCKEYNYDKTIVDSGTTNLLLPAKVFQRLTKVLSRMLVLPLGVTMAGFLAGTENICWGEGLLHYRTFPNISLLLALGHDSSFKLILSPQQYLRHVDMKVSSLPVSGDCFTFSVASSDTGAILGAVVMEAFYTIFDRGNRRIGFALSTCQGRDLSRFIAAIDGPLPFTGNTSDCVYSIHDPDRTALMLIGYVMAGVCGVCLLPIVILFVQWRMRKCRSNESRSDDTDLLHSS